MWTGYIEFVSLCPVETNRCNNIDSPEVVTDVEFKV